MRLWIEIQIAFDDCCCDLASLFPPILAEFDAAIFGRKETDDQAMHMLVVGIAMHCPYRRAVLHPKHAQDHLPRMLQLIRRQFIALATADCEMPEPLQPGAGSVDCDLFRLAHRIG